LITTVMDEMQSFVLGIGCNVIESTTFVNKVLQ